MAFGKQRQDILWSGLASYHFMASKLYFLLTLTPWGTKS
jgi:hypothetical protein